jgi:hypothetical protein
MTKLQAETDPIGFISGLMRILPPIYHRLGFESEETIKVRQIIDQAISKCNKVIEDTNKEYIDMMRKRMIKE